VHNNLFGGLGNVIGGIASELAKSGIAPQDDPTVKMINAQSELSNLHKKETELYAAIGREAYGANPSAYAQAEDLGRITGDIATIEEKIRDIEQEIKMAEQAEAEDRMCPVCGAGNADGVKFCQECGTKLEIAGKFCTECGAKNEDGTNFCRECGNKL